MLPFENLSRDADNAYFADGIHEQILTRLAKIAPANLSEIGKQLRVAHIVEGSVQKSGDAVRVNVQSIKAADDSHLSAETFDRKLTDIFSVESEVAKAIADQLRAKLTALLAKSAAERDATGLYLRSQFELPRLADRTLEQLRGCVSSP